MGEFNTSVSVNGGPEHDLDTAEGKVAIQNAVADLIDDEEARVERKKATKPELPGIEPSDADGGAGKRLLAYINRVERVQEEIDGLSEDKKEIFQEAKSFGYSVPTIRQIIKLRKMDAEKRREADALLETYCAAIGME